MERVFVATHSNLFLSRSDVSSNFVVTKEGRRVSISRILTIQDFHKLQFNLLGNSLETLFFPSAVVVVEGKTDYVYLERAIALRMAGRKVTVVPSNGDVKKKIYALKELLGDFERSPFRGRVFVVLDSVHQAGLSDELIRMGVLAAHIVVWPKNGIEFYYPTSILQSVFSASAEQVNQMAIDGDRISINGITRTKNDLATEVIKQLSDTTTYPPEGENQLLAPLSTAVA